MSVLVLAGCNHGGASPAAISAGCNDFTPHQDPDPGKACFKEEGSLPTALSFGDSVSLGYAGDVRHDLCGVVDSRHDAWTDEDIDVCGERYEPFWIGRIVDIGHNDGCSATLLDTVNQVLVGQHYNVITFNIGLHDMQLDKTTQCGLVSPMEYRDNLEAISTVIAEHADVVIWIDTTPIPAGLANEPAGEEIVFNPIAEDVAREHGFYILNLDSRGQLQDNIHYTGDGYYHLGRQVSDCILDALDQDETTSCHH